MSPLVEESAPLVEDNALFVEDDEEDTQWEITHLRANETVRSQGSMEQKSPFDGKGKSTASLDLNFLIEPKHEWEELSRFTRCNVEGQVYRVQEYVFVQPPGVNFSGAQSDDNVKEPTVHEFWVAKILEFRANDESHVYARAYWMYWPDDLPVLKDCAITEAGRRKYHGKHELIASNHMEIINVCSFAGLASVSSWQENDDDEAQTGLYWRQTFDYRTGQLSKLRKYCICQSYYNPDKIIVSCANLDCSTWLHADCLIDNILTKKCQPLNTYVVTMKGTIIKRRKSKSTKGKILPQAKKPYEGIYLADIIGGEGDVPPQVEITDLRLDNEHDMRKWTEAIVCLKCDTQIE